MSEYKDNIAGQHYRYQRFTVVPSGKSNNRKYNSIDNRRYQCRAVVSKPQKTFSVPGLFRCIIPPPMIEPYIKPLGYNIACKTCQQHTWRCGENSHNMFTCPIALCWYIQHPILGKKQHNHRSKHSQPYCFRSTFLSLIFT